ncbi:hypothetical protein PoB_005665600 [Plakobranchus ocellatus]|uniref:Uncharacterized protein n=1 Tax=Plakobranchus ocellatus TaxID=259542 RepID=A0AAV4CFK1_9GAST|nr:hypothetical protein PoB_005665600 [Plakobranchus ocellatus]
MSLARHDFVTNCVGESTLVAFDGRSVKCRGVAAATLAIGNELLESNVTVVDKIVGDVGVVIGMDIIQRLRGVLVCGNTVQFGGLACAVDCSFQLTDMTGSTEPHRADGERMVDKDFEASFNGSHWTIRYNLKPGTVPTLTNHVAQYDHGLTGTKKDAFDQEVGRWI